MKIFSYGFFQNFIVLAIMFRPVFHLELIFVSGLR